jgi:hypothetical protein
MIADDAKSLVGENCDEYSPKYVFHEASMTNLARNCLGCSNYLNNKCSKDLFNKLHENLSIN